MTEVTEVACLLATDPVLDNGLQAALRSRSETTTFEQNSQISKHGVVSEINKPGSHNRCSFRCGAFTWGMMALATSNNGKSCPWFECMCDNYQCHCTELWQYNWRDVWWGWDLQSRWHNLHWTELETIGAIMQILQCHVIPDQQLSSKGKYEPWGKSVCIASIVEANHAGNVNTYQSHLAGLLISVQNACIIVKY